VPRRSIEAGSGDGDAVDPASKVSVRPLREGKLPGVVGVPANDMIAASDDFPGEQQRASARRR
jgi:hypothetical protein